MDYLVHGRTVVTVAPSRHRTVASVGMDYLAQAMRHRRTVVAVAVAPSPHRTVASVVMGYLVRGMRRIFPAVNREIYSNRRGIATSHP